MTDKRKDENEPLKDAELDKISGGFHSPSNPTRGPIAYGPPPLKFPPPIKNKPA